eukprot:TRINITY_DN90275_c0_g1_i1.p1 TRINITY_DN90275_c0_g1~~TRINITY_DN90275_c0_g1_i1.p1  ORF type:complete len:689 (+),score=156.21 TRINITY_DN90275_c0_g1_i1:60-2126(+)
MSADGLKSGRRNVLADFFERYERIREIGRGACGVVWLLRRQTDNRPLAMKSLCLPPLAAMDEKAAKQREQAVREVEIMKSISSPHLVRYVDSVLAPPTNRQLGAELHIVTEYCDMADLATFLRRERGTGFTEKTVWGIASAVLAGLHELHRRDIVHRDLKPENILLKRCAGSSQHSSASRRSRSAGCSGRRLHGGSASAAPQQPAREDDGDAVPPIASLAGNVQVLVGDLGLARELSQSHSLASTQVGTPLYWAPEVFEEEDYKFATPADIYAYGACVYELLHGKAPFAQCSNIGALAVRVLSREACEEAADVLRAEAMDGRYSLGLREFAQDCLKPAAKDRPSCERLRERIPAAFAPGQLKKQPESDSKATVADERAPALETGTPGEQERPSAGKALQVKPPARQPSSEGLVQRPSSRMNFVVDFPPRRSPSSDRPSQQSEGQAASAAAAPRSKSAPPVRRQQIKSKGPSDVTSTRCMKDVEESLAEVEGQLESARRLELEIEDILRDASGKAEAASGPCQPRCSAVTDGSRPRQHSPPREKLRQDASAGAAGHDCEQSPSAVPARSPERRQSDVACAAAARAAAIRAACAAKEDAHGGKVHPRKLSMVDGVGPTALGAGIEKTRRSPIRAAQAKRRPAARPQKRQEPDTGACGLEVRGSPVPRVAGVRLGGAKGSLARAKAVYGRA